MQEAIFNATQWLTDSRVPALGAAARGVWLELEAYFVKSGSFELRGSLAQIAAALRMREQELKFGLDQLKQEKVYSIKYTGKSKQRVQIIDRSRKDQRESESTIAKRFAEIDNQSQQQIKKSPKKIDPDDRQRRLPGYEETGSPEADSGGEREVAVISEPASQSVANHVVELWNMIPGVIACRHVSETRKRAVSHRAKDQFWRENWQAAVERLCDIKWIRGQNSRSWQANIDWFLRPDTVLNIMEGRCDDRETKSDTDLLLEEAFA